MLTVAAGAQRRRLLRRRLGALRRAARVVALPREEGAVLVVHLLVDLGVLHLAEQRALRHLREDELGVVAERAVLGVLPRPLHAPHHRLYARAHVQRAVADGRHRRVERRRLL